MKSNDPNDEMVDCGRAMAQLFDLLDGELTAEREQRLREHITGCPHCFSEADFEKRFLGALRSARREGAAPGALRERVMHALRAEGLAG